MSTYEVIMILLTFSNNMVSFIGLIIVLIKRTKK
ncbi:putative holin-like toxin [uncultured Tyzzerella sp.]